MALQDPTKKGVVGQSTQTGINNISKNLKGPTAEKKPGDVMLSDPKVQEGINQQAQSDSIAMTRELADVLSSVSQARTIASSAALADAQSRTAHADARVAEFQATDYITRMNEQRAQQGLPAIRDISPGGPTGNMAAFADGLSQIDPIQAQLLSVMMDNLKQAQNERKPTGGILSTIFGEDLNLFGDKPTGEEKLKQVLAAMQGANSTLQPAQQNKAQNFQALLSKDVAQQQISGDAGKRMQDLMSKVADDWASGRPELAQMKIQLYTDERTRLYENLGHDREHALALAQQDTQNMVARASVRQKDTELSIQESEAKARAQNYQDQGEYWRGEVENSRQKLVQDIQTGEKKFADQVRYDLQLDASLDAIRGALSDSTGKSALLNGITLSEDFVSTVTASPQAIEIAAQSQGVHPSEVRASMIASAASSYIGDVQGARGQVDQKRLVDGLQKIIDQLNSAAVEAASPAPGLYGESVKADPAQSKAYSIAARNMESVKTEVIAQLNQQRVMVALTAARAELEALVSDKPIIKFGIADVKEAAPIREIKPSSQPGYANKVKAARQRVAELEKQLSQIKSQSVLNLLSPEPSAGEKEK